MLLKKITTRWQSALNNSYQGLLSGIKTEQALREELFLLGPLVLAGLFVGENATEKALLSSSWLLVIIVELLNSAVETVVDRVGEEHHDLSKKAKDIASCAVTTSLIYVALLWIVILFF